MVVTDILVDLFPRHRRRGVHRDAWRRSSTTSPRASAGGRRSCASSTSPFHERRREGRAARSSRPRSSWTNGARAAPRRGASPDAWWRSSAGTGSSSAARTTPSASTPGRSRARPRPEPELLGEECPECGQAAHAARPAGSVRSSGAPGTRTASTSRRSRRRRTGVTCPECKQGELVERRGRFGAFYSCSRYPECDFAVNQQPLPEPCPSAGAGRRGARRGHAVHRVRQGVGADGDELPEDEAKALVPKPRAKRPAANGRRRRDGGRPPRTASRGGQRLRSRPAQSTAVAPPTRWPR